MTRPTNPVLAQLYDTLLADAANTASDLYRNGKPRRGAPMYAAFWDGYSRVPAGEFIRGSSRAACHAAGKAFRKIQPGIQGAAGIL